MAKKVVNEAVSDSTPSTVSPVAYDDGGGDYTRAKQEAETKAKDAAQLSNELTAEGNMTDYGTSPVASKVTKPTTTAEDSSDDGATPSSGVGDSQTGTGTSSSGASSSGTTTGTTDTAADTGDDTGTGTSATDTEVVAPTLDRMESVNTDELKELLDQQVALAKEQNEKSVDYTVNQSIEELQRAEEDAAADYDAQREQINIDEAKALQNQALYAEARGDRGGIGQSQYAEIQATAAQNRRSVTEAQTKLSTDTARQISDLRAQGEFEKADAELTLTQSYLSQLQELWQWGITTNMSVEQFNTELTQWEENFEAELASITGTYKGTETASTLASAGETLLGLGIMPSDSQLAAMGFTQEQAQAILDKTTSSGSGSNTTTDDTGAKVESGSLGAISSAALNRAVQQISGARTQAEADSIVDSLDQYVLTDAQWQKVYSATEHALAYDA